MKQVGWFVLGEGKFGTRVYGDEFVPVHKKDSLKYWEDRGYYVVPVFVNEED